jgi:CBS domain containing-hemolysin-like protein
VISSYVEEAAIGFFLALLVFLSSIEAALTQSSPVTLRTKLEPESGPAPKLLSVVLDDKMQVLVPLHLGTQISLIVIAILTTHLCLERWSTWGLGVAFIVISLLSLVFRQLLPRLITQNNSEAKLVRLLVAFRPVYGMLRSLALPLSSILNLFKRRHEEAVSTAGPTADETTEEEMQAYLDIGEDEGILEEEDTKLIQSVVEFGDTLVREVMTPRTKIVACEEASTIGQLRDTMIRHRHSRIPIYRGDIDHIIGIAYIRQLLAYSSREHESEPITPLIHPALFVPETKRVSTLLKELQERGDHTAIVIDEFGGVAGLVTIEDLVEEIVGEIRDEDQAKTTEVVEESPRSYLLGGSTELHRLEELAGKRFEALDASTVAGLIIAFLGRVPSPGEEFDIDSLHVQILDADRKRIHRVRITLPVDTLEGKV